MPSKSDESSVMAEEVGAKRSKEDLELELETATETTTRGKNEKNSSNNIDTTKKVSEGAWKAMGISLEIEEIVPLPLSSALSVAILRKRTTANHVIFFCVFKAAKIESS